MSAKLTTLILVCVLVGCAYSVTLFLPPGHIFSDSPIYTDDYAMHFSQCLSARRFFLSEARCWGYDPFFLAGYPSGALVNADNKAWELLFLICYPLSEGFAFKLYLILFLLLYPFFTYAAARNFGLSRGTSIIALVMALLFFYLSITIDLVSWGMVSYVFMCYFSLFVFSLVYRLLDHFTWRRYALLALFSSLLLSMHILSPVHLFIPLLILYACSIKKLPPARHLLMMVLALIVLMANSYWLVPLAHFFSDKTTRPENYTFALQITNVLEPLNVYIRQQQSNFFRKTPSLNNTFIEVILLVFGICGCYRWWREKKPMLLVPFAGGVLFIFAVAYYGSHTALFPQLQPQRFIVPLNILLLIPASAGIAFTLHTLFKDRSIAASLFISSLLFAVLAGPVIKPLKTINNYNLYRLTCDFSPAVQELLAWLDQHTTREGRILIEDSEYDTGHQYGGAHLPALFPEYLKREYLCGPRPLYPIKHSYASFTAGVLFEKKIGDYSLGEFKRQCDLYNVKWIVCWFDPSKEFFDRYPDYLTTMGKVGTFTIYEVNRKPSFFLKGSGDAAADYNRLELNHVIPEGGEIIIGYHWMQGLRTEPERTLERVYRGGDPVGFIRIVDPPPSLTVLNGY